MKRVHLTPAANREIAEAAEWYEARQAGLSDRFFEEIDNALALIRHHPSAFLLLPDLPPDLQVRRALLDRFPYSLIFLELPSEIRIIAISHLKRRPGYWLSRLGI